MRDLGLLLANPAFAIAVIVAVLMLIGREQT